MNKVTFDKFGEALNLLEDVKYAIETDKEIGLTEKSEFKKHFNFFDRYYEDEKEEQEFGS